MTNETSFYLILGAFGLALFFMKNGENTGAPDFQDQLPVNTNQNVEALMATIRAHESANNYGATYANKMQISNFADHPANLGWGGVILPDEYCRAVNLAPGCKSTAAGAYQFIRPTWNRLRDKLGLLDFHMASQDAAAYEYLRELGAIDLILDGDIDEALRAASKAWASMPYSKSGQPKASLAAVIDEYRNFGGTVA